VFGPIGQGNISRGLGPGVWQSPEGSFSLEDIAGLVTHLDLSSEDNVVFPGTSGSGQPISQATDLSGQGKHYVQATGANQPTWNTGVQNGLGAILFDGSNDVIANSSPPVSGTTEGCLFAVCRTTDLSTTVSGGFRFGSGASQTHYSFSDDLLYVVFGSALRRDSIAQSPAGVIRAWHVLEMYSKTNDWALLVNGTSLRTAATNTVAWHTAFQWGMSVTTPWKGYLGELAFYTPVPSAAQRAQIRTYLQSRWGI
jgi:hypothetical protein